MRRRQPGAHALARAAGQVADHYLAVFLSLPAVLSAPPLSKLPPPSLLCLLSQSPSALHPHAVHTPTTRFTRSAGIIMYGHPSLLPDGEVFCACRHLPRPDAGGAGAGGADAQSPSLSAVSQCRASALSFLMMIAFSSRAAALPSGKTVENFIPSLYVIRSPRTRFQGVC